MLLFLYKWLIIWLALYMGFNKVQYKLLNARSTRKLPDGMALIFYLSYAKQEELIKNRLIVIQLFVFL